VRIVWSRQAIADLEIIQAYLLEESPRASNRIWLRIVERVANQITMPFAAPVDGDGPARRLIVSGTPYIVLYCVVDDELRVEAVFHSSQDR
jgi:plasmid stabilization system protein ParE